MLFTPCLTVPNNKMKLFDPQLCLVCQRKVEVAMRGRPQEKKVEYFEVFVDVFKTFKNHGDLRFFELQEAIKGKTAKMLHGAQYCFHTTCWRQFSLIHKNQCCDKDKEEDKSSSS